MKPVSPREMKVIAKDIRKLLSEISAAYPEVREWCYSANQDHSMDKPHVQLSTAGDPTGETVVNRTQLTDALAYHSRNLLHARRLIQGFGVWLEYVQHDQANT